MRKLIAAAILTVILAVGAVGCDDGSGTSASVLESNRQASSYGNVVKDQPAHVVKYSPARADKNFWIDTWGQGPKNAYVYLLTGDRVFFYVMGGPPTNRCDSLTPPDYYSNSSNNDYDVLRPAPRVDGVYPMGGTCTTYIGKDATTGGYLEFTLNMNTLMLVYGEAQPFPENVLTPLGDTKANK